MAGTPLLGDGHGHFRVHIVGNSGNETHQTTLASELSTILGLPHLSLDALFWQPGWKKTPTDEFRDKIVQFMNDNQDGFVIDGQYTSLIGDIVSERATDVIWLNPPLALYFPRLVYRTFLRLLGLAPPCSPGCPEMFREVFFSKDSIIWWSLSHHWVSARKWNAQMAVMGIGVESVPPEKQKLRRIGGWGGELKKWIDSVKVFVKEQRKSL